MSSRLIGSLLALMALLVYASIASAQTARAQNPDAFDPHDLSGKWVRISPFQAFSNVPGGIPIGGANLAEQIRKGLGCQEFTNGGQFVEEAPFTAEGKKMFDANLPSYGRSWRKRLGPADLLCAVGGVQIQQANSG